MVYVLAILVVFLAWRVWAHHRAVLLVRRALEARQLILRDKAPTKKATSWDRLIEVTNALITDTRRLDHLRATQHSQLQATLDSIQEAVLILDGDNHIRLTNPAFASFFPSAGNQIIGQRLETILHSSAFSTYVAEARHDTTRATREFSFEHKQRTLWFEVSAAPVVPLRTLEEAEAELTNTKQRVAPADTELRFPEAWTLLVLHDITRQKHLEEVRKDFVANVSHELRTPLTVIKGYVETLADDDGSMRAEDRVRFLSTVQRHAERLHRIVEDLLVLSRLESDTPDIKPEPTDLCSLLTTIAMDYAMRGYEVEKQTGGTTQRITPAGARAQTPTHRLVLDLPEVMPLLALDSMRMTQVFGNLLDNGLKYTPPGSRICVRVSPGENEWQITVADNGPGISASDVPRLFERFYRADKGRSRESGGTGLGLSIVKHIVQLHGGRVTAASRQAPTTDPAGAGTTFTITLPSIPSDGGNVTNV